MIDIHFPWDFSFSGNDSLRFLSNARKKQKQIHCHQIRTYKEMISEIMAEIKVNYPFI